MRTNRLILTDAAPASDDAPEAKLVPAPPVSIAMTSYNGAAFIGEQLESFRAQTLLPLEVVITDDGSTDDTENVVRAFAQTAPFPVHYLRNARRLGFQDNFLAAAAQCKGAFIAFSDQDDVWLPHKLERGYRALVDHDAVLSTHGAIITDEQLKSLGRLQHGVEQDRVYPPSSFQAMPGNAYGFTLMFRRELLDYVTPALRPHVPGEPETILYHDVWVCLLASAFGSTVHIAEPLALYRQHGQNALGASKYNPFRRLLGHAAVPLAIYRKNEVYARQCAHAFSESARGLSGDLRSQAQAAARFHLNIAANLHDRLALYQSHGFSAKYAAYDRLLRSQAYRSKSHGGLGFTALVKDLLLGFLGPRKQEAISAPVVIHKPG